MFSFHVSGVSDEINFVILCDFMLVPSRPPANVTGYNITSTCIRVQWEQIPTRYVHGILLGYKVSFIATDCGNQRPWNETTVSPSTTSAVITNLRKYTKYMVSVEGFTIKGSGQHSKCVAITTAEDSKINNFKINNF